MESARGIVQQGRIELLGPVDWPDGTEVAVSAVPNPTADLHGSDPESIARWLAEFDAIPPIEMSAAEEADWHAARAQQRELDKQRMSKIDFE